MKHLISTFLAGVLFSTTLSAQTLYGGCGTDSSTVKWEFDATQGILFIGGEGTMKNFTPGEAPWHPFQKKIRAVAIGNKVTSIGKCAFAKCYGIDKVLFSASVENIGDSAFFACHSLRDFEIKTGVREIAPSAFLSCLNLKKFTVAEGNKNFSVINEALVDNAHSRLIALPPAYESDEYAVPATLRELGCGAFFACKKLKSVIIPSQITSIQEGAFTLCTELKSIHVQDNHPVFTIKDGILYDKNLTKVIACPGGRSKTTVSLPATVTEVGAFAFSDCHAIKEIELPASVRKLGRNAFATCFALKEINLPEGITTIPDYAFGGCIGMSSISLPSTVTHVGKNAFEDCRSLKEIAFPDGVEELPEFALRACHELKRLTLPPRLRAIGSHCFANCFKLQDLQLPGTLERIGTSAFQDCHSLTRIDLPENLTEVGEHAFVACTGLKHLHVARNIRPGFEKALYDESMIFSLQDETIESLANAFSLYELKEVTVDENNPYYSAEDGILYDKGKTRLIFAGGTRHNVEIPETVREIAPFAFIASRVFRIHVPQNVVRFGDYSLPYFKDDGKNYGIHIYMHSAIPPFLSPKQIVRNYDAEFIFTTYNKYTGRKESSQTIREHKLKTTLHVPEGCMDKYANDAVWGNLFNPQTAKIKDDVQLEKGGGLPADDTGYWTTGIEVLIRHTEGYNNPSKGTGQEINTMLEIIKKEGNATLRAKSEEALLQIAQRLTEDYNKTQKKEDVAASMVPYYKKAMTLEQLKEVAAALSSEQAQRAYALSQTSIQHSTTSTEMVLAIMALAAGETPAPLTPKECTPAYRELAERFSRLLNLKGNIETMLQKPLPKEEGTDDKMSDFMDRYRTYFADNIETLMLNIYIGVLSEEDLRILCDIFQKPSGQAAMKAIQYMAEDPFTLASSMNEKFRTWAAQRIKEL